VCNDFGEWVVKPGKIRLSVGGGQPGQDVITPVQNIDIILSGDNIVFNTKM